jgi:hypothetical protein
VTATTICPHCRGWRLYGGEICDVCRGDTLLPKEEPVPVTELDRLRQVLRDIMEMTGDPAIIKRIRMELGPELNERGPGGLVENCRNPEVERRCMDGEAMVLKPGMGYKPRPVTRFDDEGRLVLALLTDDQVRELMARMDALRAPAHPPKDPRYACADPNCPTCRG